MVRQLISALLALAPLAPLAVFAAFGPLAIGCGDDAKVAATSDASDATDSADADRPDAPTPWIYPEDVAEVTPSLSAATLETALKTAMSAALELDPDAVRTLHEALYPTPKTGSGDPTGCPFFLTYDYGTAKAFYWQGECTASDGTKFSGSGSIADYDHFQNEYGTFTGFDVTLAGRIEKADGTWLEGSGEAAGYSGEAQDLTSYTAMIDGTFTAGGPGAPDSPWLDGSRRPSLTVTGWTYTPTGGTNVTVAGGISGLDFPPGVSAVAFDDLTARQQSAGATCEKELGGGAGVRGDDGNWYDVLFDGPNDETAETPPALCDGCGDTWFRGQDVGKTCVDAKPYFKWEGLSHEP